MLKYKCKITLDQVTTDLSPDELIRRGYRRTSIAYCMVSRIDRPDWLQVLATKMRCVVADFYNLDGSGISGSWADHYRACFSQDSLTVHPDIIHLIPTSGHDPVGYVELKDDEVKK